MKEKKKDAKKGREWPDETQNAMWWAILSIDWLIDWLWSINEWESVWSNLIRFACSFIEWIDRTGRQGKQTQDHLLGISIERLAIILPVRSLQTLTSSSRLICLSVSDLLFSVSSQKGRSPDECPLKRPQIEKREGRHVDQFLIWEVENYGGIVLPTDQLVERRCCSDLTGNITAKRSILIPSTVINRSIYRSGKSNWSCWGDKISGSIWFKWIECGEWMRSRREGLAPTTRLWLCDVRILVERNAAHDPEPA